MACSGHAATHRPQASQAASFGVNACFQPCINPFILPLRDSPARSCSGKTPIAKTPVGQTEAQAALPSHLFRSITGTYLMASRKGGSYL